MKWLFRIYLLLAIVALLAFYGPQADAHQDGDKNRDGHYYTYPTGGITCPTGDPVLTGQCYATAVGNAYCEDQGFGFGTNLKQWRFRMSNNAFDNCSGGAQATPLLDERHCGIGYYYDGDSCEINVGSICDYGEFPVSWNAVDDPFYITVADPEQGESCVWVLDGSSAASGGYDVTYVSTLGTGADEDAFSNADRAYDDGAAVPGPPAVNVGDEPVWPWDEGTGGFGGLPDEERCNPTQPAFWAGSWPHTSTPLEDACINGCEALQSGSKVCLGTADGGGPTDMCSGYFTYTGEACVGSEDWLQGAEGGVAGGTDLTGVEQRLEAIYDRLGSQTSAIIASQTLGDAAIVEAINENGGGTGECADSSCDGTVPTDGDAVGTVEESGQGFMDRVAEAPIVAAIESLGSAWPAGSCDGATTDQIAVLAGTDQEYITFEAHCDLWTDIAPLIEGVMLFVWTLSSGVVIFRA